HLIHRKSRVYTPYLLLDNRSASATSIRIAASSAIPRTRRPAPTVQKIVRRRMFRRRHSDLFPPTAKRSLFRGRSRGERIHLPAATIRRGSAIRPAPAARGAV